MTQPDAYLIHLGEELRALCAKQDELMAAVDGMPGRHPEHDPTWARIRAGTTRYHKILNTLRDTPATTLEGMRVKAWSVLQTTAPGGEVPQDHEDGRVAWSLAMDVLGKGRTTQATTQSPEGG